MSGETGNNSGHESDESGYYKRSEMKKENAAAGTNGDSTKIQSKAAGAPTVDAAETKAVSETPTNQEAGSTQIVTATTSSLTSSTPAISTSAITPALSGVTGSQTEEAGKTATEMVTTDLTGYFSNPMTPTASASNSSAMSNMYAYPAIESTSGMPHTVIDSASGVITVFQTDMPTYTDLSGTQPLGAKNAMAAAAAVGAAHSAVGPSVVSWLRVRFLNLDL